MEKNSEKKSLRDRNWVITLEIIAVIAAFTGFGIKDIFVFYKECKTEKTEKFRKEAISIFKNTPSDTAKLKYPIKLLHDLYKREPEDTSGYILLIERAELIMSIGDCQHYGVAENLLKEAIKLNGKPTKAENRLIDLEKLKKWGSASN